MGRGAPTKLGTENWKSPRPSCLDERPHERGRLFVSVEVVDCSIIKVLLPGGVEVRAGERAADTVWPRAASRQDRAGARGGAVSVFD